MFKTPYVRVQPKKAVQTRISMIFLLSFLMFFTSSKVNALFSHISNVGSMEFLHADQSHLATENEKFSSDEPFSYPENENKNEKSDSKESVADFEIDEFILHTIPNYFNGDLKITYSLLDLSLTLPPWALLPLIPPDLI